MSSTIAYGNIELKSSFEIIQLKVRIERKIMSMQGFILQV